MTDYALDVTLTAGPCWIPFDGDDLVTGVMHVSPECPGNAVAIFHEGGQEEAEAWCRDNDDWLEILETGVLPDRFFGSVDENSGVSTQEDATP